MPNIWTTKRLIALFILPTALSFGIEARAQDAQSDRQATSEEGSPTASDAPQILEQGPIHEAFAAPTGEPGAVEESEMLTIDQEPPQPINELPPSERPEGSNVEWISGYWMWVQDQEDFVWVSGVWREVPPNRQWVPGAWVEQGDGYAWSSGFWAEASNSQVSYLPPPPESLEQGPSSPAPSEQHFYVPGCWVYQNQNYAWRAGYWNQGQSDWVWVPSYYNRTPRGYVYINGYWDMPLARRGVLYAPVSWSNRGYRNSGFRYQPRSVVDTGLLIANLFVNSGRNQYYYGGYGLQNRGYQSWYNYTNQGPRRYDPLYSYYRRNGVPGGRSFADIERHYQGFDNRDGDRGNRGNRGDRGDRGVDRLIASSYADIEGRGAQRRMEEVQSQERDRIMQSIDRERNLGRDRASLEATVANALDRANRNGRRADEDLRSRGNVGDIADAAQNGRRQQVLKLPVSDAESKAAGDAGEGRGSRNGPRARSGEAGETPRQGRPGRDQADAARQAIRDQQRQAREQRQGRQRGDAPNNPEASNGRRAQSGNDQKPNVQAPNNVPTPNAQQPNAPRAERRASPSGSRPSASGNQRGFQMPQVPNRPGQSATTPGQATYNRGIPNQQIPNQVRPNRGNPSQAIPNRGIPNQGMQNRGIPNQGMQNRGIPNQGMPNRGMQNRGIPNQGAPNRGMPGQARPSQGRPSQAAPNASNFRGRTSGSRPTASSRPQGGGGEKK